MSREDYWSEILEVTLVDMGVDLPIEQIRTLASAVESGANLWGEYGSYRSHSGGVLTDDTKRLEAELRQEREKILCIKCYGRGRIVLHGPYHTATSDCIECRGAGRV